MRVGSERRKDDVYDRSGADGQDAGGARTRLGLLLRSMDPSLPEPTEAS